MQLQHSAAAMAAGDQNQPTFPTTMKDEIKTYMYSGDATKKSPSCKITRKQGRL